MCIYHVYNYIFFVICILVTLNFSQRIQNTEFLINIVLSHQKIFPNTEEILFIIIIQFVPVQKFI